VPIALFSYPGFNVINLVTSVAAKNGNALKLIRMDPVRTAKHAKDKLEMKVVNDRISGLLLDNCNVNLHDANKEWAYVDNMAHATSLPKEQDRELEQKSNW
jgi:hypothetical protein